VKDYSSCGNHATIYGGVSWIEGSWGWALELNGISGYLRVEDSPSLKNLTAVSVEVWIRPTLDGNAHDVISKSRDNLDGSFWLRIRPANDIWFLIRLAGTNYGSPTQALTSNVWQHVVGVYDGTSVYLYYNGNLVGSKSATAGTLTTDEPLFVGRQNITGYEYYYLGLLAFPRIYGRALSGTEINAHFQLTRGIFGV